MPSQVTFVKQDTQWLAMLPRLILLVLLSALFYQFSKQLFLFWAVIANVFITYAIKRIFMPRFVYKGIQLIELAEFEKAIPFIQKSIDFYTKNNWIDYYRYVLLISTSKRTMKESCLCNLAYCYLQSGEAMKAKEMYEAISVNYPNNPIAISMLRTINSLLMVNAE